MNERIENVKSHIRKHSTTYIVGGTCLAVGVLGGLYLKRPTTFIDGDLSMKIDQVGFWNAVNPTTINLIERSTPSKPVHLVGTNLYFNSMSEAARETGHPLSTLSKHINGHIPNVKGDVFKLLEPAA